MSWIRNHFRHFVIPGIHALARADGKALLEEDIKPSDRIVRPSSKCNYVEAGMLLSVCSSILKKSNPTREVALGLCRQVGKVGDAEFVYELDLGGRGLGNRVKDLGFGYQGVEGADVLHSFISNSIKELKRRTRKQATAIYPGRDVWCWEVMSQRQGMPSHYDSKVSRAIASNPKAIKKVIEPWKIPDWEKTVLFDTGHQGTVPRAIGEAAGVKNPNIVMLSAIDPEYQIFRTHAKSRKKALACEYLAKYRRRAIVRDDAPYQELADLEEFIKAALLTIWLWYHVSPGRLPAWRDQAVIKTKDGLKFGNNFSVGGPSIVSAPTGALTLNIPGINWASAAADTGSFFFDPASTSSWNNASITTAGSNWDISNTSIMTDGWGTSFVPVPNPKKVTPAIDVNTFGLVDPVSKAPLEPAMDAKAMGLDPVQFEIQRARAEMLNNLHATKVSGQHPPQGHNVGQYPGPPLPPAGVTAADHQKALEAARIKKKANAVYGITSKDIVAYETAKLNATTARANNDTAKRLEPIKAQIPAIMARANAPLSGQLPDISLVVEVDKDTGGVMKTITYKTPLIANQPGGVPLPSSLPTPTAGRPVRQVTDGSGKAII